MLCLGNSASAGDRLEGKDLYNKYCAPCHGEEGDGPIIRSALSKTKGFYKRSIQDSYQRYRFFAYGCRSYSCDFCWCSRNIYDAVGYP
ncbi:MAG: c-type cytochrome [Planctomycetota bacterium]